MAGYRTSGDRFVNATAINTQIIDQREAYDNTSQQGLDFNDPNASGKGIARSTTPLFSMPDDVFESSVAKFNTLDSFVMLGNPDFSSGADLSSLKSGDIFGIGPTMFNDVSSQSDKPNVKGPNLIAPDINDATFTNTDQSTSQFENRGFGWRDQRNEPGTEPARIGEYFSKHYRSDGNNLNKPILGEAKSPSNDPNIDYDQPI